MLVAEQLAEFAAGAPLLPATARAATVRAVLDLMTAAVAGWATAGATAAREGARRSWGLGRASCWFSDLRLTAPGAAFANAAAAAALDLDDGHRAAAGHPGAAIIPAVIADAEQQGAGVDQVLVAIAVGYDVAVRISAARDFSALPTMSTGIWCGQGVAAALGALRGLPPAHIAQAIAIAGTVAPAMAPVGYSRLAGNHVKEGIPAATATGITAVDLAEAGFTGPLDLLDHASYAAATLVGGLGARWMVEGVYFKPYSCCRWAHAAIDGALDLMAAHAIVPAEIERIDVETFGRALRLGNEVAPRTLESAQYSVPFCVALAVLRGPDALLPMLDDALADAAVPRLAARVHLHLDPTLDAMFSAAVPARVTLTARGRRFTATVTAPRGEPTNPMSVDDLTHKLHATTARCGVPDAAGPIVAAIRSLERGDLAPLLEVLRTRRGAVRARAEPAVS